jgi:hypothetical protein
MSDDLCFQNICQNEGLQTTFKISLLNLRKCVPISNLKPDVRSCQRNDFKSDLIITSTSCFSKSASQNHTLRLTSELQY